MTSERKEIVFRGGILKTVWRRITSSQANDAWDLACMTLILIESMKLRFTEETKPDCYEPEPSTAEGDGKTGQPLQPKWGAQPAADPIIRELQREQRQQSGMQWGAVNKPVVW